jgi:hyperosmotically inducible protein
MRTLIRFFLGVVLLVAIGFFLFGWWSSSSVHKTAERPKEAPTATSGTIDTSTARERGAEIGEKTAIAAQNVKETVEEASLSAKIKAKMVLDDQVKARSIDVSTSGTTVTLSGTVRSEAEHARALRLARETAGVGDVVDHLRVER